MAMAMKLQRRTMLRLGQRLFSSSATSGGSVVAACVLERGPVIWGAMPTWESEYLEWKQRRDWLVSKEFVGDDNKDEDTQQVAQEDDEDEDEVSARDADALRVHPTFTAADEANDHRSLQRKLDQSLYLVVKHAGEGAQWQFPQGERSDSDESMRDAAKRRAMDCSQNNFYMHMVGNAPIVHTEHDSSKVFYYHSLLCSGSVISESNTEIEDWAWVTSDEAKEYLAADVFDAVRPVLSSDVDTRPDDLHVFPGATIFDEYNAFGAPPGDAEQQTA